MHHGASGEVVVEYDEPRKGSVLKRRERAVCEAVVSSPIDLSGMVGVYVDDFLAGTDTVEDLVFVLREVYVPLAKQKLYANPEKCCLGQSEVEYCGFIIGRNGIRPEPRKLMAVHVWPQLQNSTDVKSFMGL